MEANVKVLMDATGCSEVEARTSLDASFGDLPKALELLGKVTKDALVIHVQFTSFSHTKAKGFLILGVNILSKEIMLLDIIFPLTDENARMMDINMPPLIFANSLNAVREKIPDKVKINYKMYLSGIRSKLSSDFIQALITLYKSSQLDKINQRFTTLVNEALNESFSVGFYTTLLSSQEVNNLIMDLPFLKYGAAVSSTNKETQFSKMDGFEDLVSGPIPNVVLICEPEISPLKGKPVKDIEIGDEIVVKIKDARENARYFAELLGGNIGDELIPLIVPVVLLEKLDKGICKINIEFGPGINGEFYVPQEVKIKTKEEDMEIVTPFVQEESVFSEGKFYNQVLSGFIVLFISVITLIIVFIKFR